MGINSFRIIGVSPCVFLCILRAVRAALAAGDQACHI
jgi:hypothetical protein